MQVEKDILVARDIIENNVYSKIGYRPVKLFTDQTLKSFKKIKMKNKDILCKINSIDEVFDIVSYNGNVETFSDNRFDEYFMKLKIAALSLDRKDYFSFFLDEYGKYSYTFSYDIYKSIRNLLDDKTKYFFDELYKKYFGKKIRRSFLFEKSKYNFEELTTLVRYSLSKEYNELRDRIESENIKFTYSSDKKIINKKHCLYDFIYLSYNITNMTMEEIKKYEKLILELFKNILKENGKIQSFYSEKDIETSFDSLEYRSNPSKNQNMAYIYTYKNKTIEK